MESVFGDDCAVLVDLSARAWRVDADLPPRVCRYHHRKRPFGRDERYAIDETGIPVITRPDESPTKMAKIRWWAGSSIML